MKRLVATAVMVIFCVFVCCNVYGVNDELRRAAEAGDVKAQIELGEYYARNRKFDDAEIWYCKAAEQNSAQGRYELAKLVIRRKKGADRAEAIKLIIEAAEQNYAPAMLELASCYANGNGVPKDRQMAQELRLKAAETGNAHAQWCYANSLVSKKDHQGAFQWYKKAAEQNDHFAQRDLAYCYKFGRGVKQNYAEALKWFEKAAESKMKSAFCEIGNLYAEGKGVPQDVGKALEYYRKAGEFYAPAGLRIADIYRNGSSGVAKDIDKAFKLYERIVTRSAQNEAKWIAHIRLGDLYANGEGVEKDYRKALKYYRKAADRLYAEAEYKIGQLYEKGQGVPRDLNEAAKWYHKASKRYVCRKLPHPKAKAAYKRVMKLKKSR